MWRLLVCWAAAVQAVVPPLVTQEQLDGSTVVSIAAGAGAAGGGTLNVWYTLDGSDPDIGTGAKYTGPFEVREPRAPLRAIAVDIASGLRSRVAAVAIRVAVVCAASIVTGIDRFAADGVVEARIAQEDNCGVGYTVVRVDNGTTHNNAATASMRAVANTFESALDGPGSVVVPLLGGNASATGEIQAHAIGGYTLRAVASREPNAVTGLEYIPAEPTIWPFEVVPSPTTVGVRVRKVSTLMTPYFDVARFRDGVAGLLSVPVARVVDVAHRDATAADGDPESITYYIVTFRFAVVARADLAAGVISAETAAARFLQLPPPTVIRLRVVQAWNASATAGAVPEYATPVPTDSSPITIIILIVLSGIGTVGVFVVCIRQGCGRPVSGARLKTPPPSEPSDAPGPAAAEAEPEDIVDVAGATFAVPDGFFNTTPPEPLQGSFSIPEMRSPGSVYETMYRRGSTPPNATPLLPPTPNGGVGGREATEVLRDFITSRRGKRSARPSWIAAQDTREAAKGGSGGRSPTSLSEGRSASPVSFDHAGSRFSDASAGQTGDLLEASNNTAGGGGGGGGAAEGFKDTRHVVATIHALGLMVGDGAVPVHPPRRQGQSLQSLQRVPLKRAGTDPRRVGSHRGVGGRGRSPRTAMRQRSATDLSVETPAAGAAVVGTGGFNTHDERAATPPPQVRDGSAAAVAAVSPRAHPLRPEAVDGARSPTTPHDDAPGRVSPRFDVLR